MLCFSRDTEINQLSQIDQENASKSKPYDGPPSGIVPFHGICMFGTNNTTFPSEFHSNLISYLIYRRQISIHVISSRSILLPVR